MINQNENFESELQKFLESTGFEDNIKSRGAFFSGASTMFFRLMNILAEENVSGEKLVQEMDQINKELGYHHRKITLISTAK